jgi:hypothetical protein
MVKSTEPAWRIDVSKRSRTTWSRTTTTDPPTAQVRVVEVLPDVPDLLAVVPCAGKHAWPITTTTRRVTILGQARL